MERLISLSEFIDNLDYEADSEDEMNRLCVYHKFLKQIPTIGMFIPNDLKGNFLEEPRREYYDSMTGWNCPEDAYNYENKLSNYKEAENRVLFKGFKWINGKHVSNEDFDIYFDSDGIKAYNGFKMTDLCSIEKLIEFNLKLTESAIKQIVNENN